MSKLENIFLKQDYMKAFQLYNDGKTIITKEIFLRELCTAKKYQVAHLDKKNQNNSTYLKVLLFLSFFPKIPQKP